MPNKTRSTFLKRQKEMARQARRKDKQAKRLGKKEADSDADHAADPPTEDPDLAGITLGPQPRPDDLDADDEGEDPADAA